MVSPVLSAGDLRRGQWAPERPGWSLLPVVPRGGTYRYQLDFVMPGSSPRCAIDRKQIRHRPNLL